MMLIRRSTKTALLLSVLMAFSMPIMAADGEPPQGTHAEHASASTNRGTLTAPRIVGPEGIAANRHTAEGQSEADLATDRFCRSIADTARDERYKRREEQLSAMTDQVEAKVAELEERRQELEGWLQRREDFIEMANAALLDVYTRMDPQAAAERLALVEPMLASAMLMKMPSQKAGTILNEMEPESAANVTRIMAASAETEDQ